MLYDLPCGGGGGGGNSGSRCWWLGLTLGEEWMYIICMGLGCQ